ncbi:FTSH protease 11 [Perilla frutescens var. frutescens]|nr:FTSH protease 11 [Perilla frutescens var. frutescens]
MENVTTGASSDLNTATELAQYMVSSCGMSDKIRPVHIKERPGSEMASRIDAEHEKALHGPANALPE